MPDKPVVIHVGADPEPYDYIVLLEAQSAPAHSEPDRVSGILFANTLEIETGVIWIGFP